MTAQVIPFPVPRYRTVARAGPLAPVIPLPVVPVPIPALPAPMPAPVILTVAQLALWRAWLNGDWLPR